MSKLVSKAELFKVFSQLTSQSYNINPAFIKITGSIKTGYLLTQLCYLARAFKYEPFYRTDETLEKTYHFSKKELASARAKLKSLGLITTERLGIPARLYYTINLEKIIELVSKLPDFDEEPLCDEGSDSYAKREQLDMLKGDNRQLPNGTTNNNDLNNELFINKEKEKQTKEKKLSFPKPNPQPQAKPSGVCLKEQFEKFWEAYDYKENRKQAETAFKKAIKSVSLEQILESIRRQAVERDIKLKYGVFCPRRCLPTTWLNGERWRNPVQSEEEIRKEAPKKERYQTARERSVDLARRTEQAMDEVLMEILGTSEEGIKQDFENQLKKLGEKE